MKDVLLHPLVSEKLSAQGEHNIYGFVVAKGANKISIKQAVETKYQVRVLGVRTMVQAGRRKMRYTKKGAIAGHTSAKKKAIVQLAPGDMIDFYEAGNTGGKK